MFRNSGYRMLLQGGEIPNAKETSEVCSSQSRPGDFRKPGIYSGPGSFGNSFGQNGWNLEGRALSALSRFGENARMVSDPAWLRRVEQQNAIMESLGGHVAPKAEISTLSSILSEKGVHGSFYLIGEILFIARPLIYVLFIRKYGTQSWAAWFLSLAMDVVGVGIFSQVTLSGWGSKDRKFEYTTSAKVIELIFGAQTRYTYMSGS